MLAVTGAASIVVLTGAGVSAESGIDTFRGVDGLWENHRIEEVASPQGFARDPQLVQRFYNLRRRQLQSTQIRPNAAHAAIVRLEQAHLGKFLLVTQNIDDLHERAGSREMVHMHGELLKKRCTACGRVAPVRENIDPAATCDDCGRPETARPHVVWFGEMPLMMDIIYRALEHCDLFLSVGTSGNVYPAAGFVDIATAAAARTIEFNLDPSEVASAFGERVYGPATATVPAFVDRFLEPGSERVKK